MQQLLVEVLQVIIQDKEASELHIYNPPSLDTNSELVLVH